MTNDGAEGNAGLLVQRMWPAGSQRLEGGGIIKILGLPKGCKHSLNLG